MISRFFAAIMFELSNLIIDTITIQLFEDGDGMKKYRCHLAALLLLFVFPSWAAVFFDLEGGAVFNSYNDVGIPGDTGTRFSLTDDLQVDPSAFVRLRIGIHLGRRHTLSLLYAPLKAEASGSTGFDINYFGVMFTNGTPLSAEYKFNSYRLTYRYRFKDSKKWRIGAGLSLKIRDAHIRLSGGGVSAEKSNIGFVPLINFRFEYRLSPQWSFLFRGDALAAPQGRAEDVLLAIRFQATGNLAFRMGYRLLEGGADNDEVYNFTAFHYLAFAAILQL